MQLSLEVAGASRDSYARDVAAAERRGASSSLEDLVLRARAGDHAAFDVLVQSATRRLYGIALRILRDTHLAEDLVQESLIDAWRDLRALRDPGLFDAWVTRILVRNCYRRARRERSARQVLHTVPEESLNPMAQIDDRDRLERAFRQLTPDHRVVVVLRYYLDWEPAEIAEVLALAPGTVRSRLHYALAGLRRSLEGDAGSGRVAEPGR